MGLESSATHHPLSPSHKTLMGGKETTEGYQVPAQRSAVPGLGGRLLTTVFIDTILRKVVGSDSNKRALATECLLQTATRFYTPPADRRRCR